MAQRPIIKDSIMALSLAVTALILAELALRMDGYASNETQVTREENEPAYQQHPVYRVSLKPDLHRSFLRVDQGRPVVTQWTTNSRSFRGGEIRSEKPAMRVVVYGDSNVFAQFSDLADTFPFKLQELLHQMTGEDVEVINAGMPGFGPDQSLLRLGQEVDFLKPDIVVFHVFADNDFGDLIRNRIFVVDSSGQLVRTPLDQRPDPCFENSASCLKDLSSSGLKTFLSSLAVIEASRDLMRQIPFLEQFADPSASSVIRYYLDLCETEYRFFEHPGPQRPSHFADHYDYDLALDPTRDSARTKVTLMKGILHRAKELAATKQVQLLVTVQPSSFDLTTHLHPNFTDFERFPGYRRDRLAQIVEQAAQAEGIDVINLFDLFSNHAPDRLFFTNNDDHWSEAGQELAAQTVATFIHDRYMSVGRHSFRTVSMTTRSHRFWRQR
jgi:acetyltransferase AlgX (SGNH hydrolase-like protein)